MRRSMSIYLLGLSALVSGVTFISPAPADVPGNTISNYVTTIDSPMTIQWSLQPDEESSPLKMFIFQDISDATAELVRAMPANSTVLDWYVDTGKSLSDSHSFHFELWFENANEAAATSHAIDIADGESSSATSTTITSTSPEITLSSATSTILSNPPRSTTSTVSLASSTSTSPLHSSSSVNKLAADISSTSIFPSSILTTTTRGTSTASSSPSKAASNTSTPVPSSNSLSTGAKIGLGLGISAMVILAVTIGWFVLAGRREKKESMPPTHSQAGESSPENFSGFVEFTSPIAGRHEVG